MVQTKTRVAAAAFLVALCLGGAAARAQPAIPAAPKRWFTDKAGFVSTPAAARLDAQLAGYARASGHQVIVYIDRTTGGVPIEEWAVRAFEAWGVGGKGKDDGLALFIFSEDRKARVEVGYGLEDRVTDLQANRIVQERLLPGIRSGERDAALTSTVAALLATVEGRPVSGLEPDARTPVRKPLTGGQLLLMLVLGVGLLILFITNPSLALFLLFQLASGGRGGSHRGGGGFGGGGGRSGGGGATGSW